MLTTKRRKAGIASIALAGALTVSAVYPATAFDLVWARDGDADSLDPHRATSTLSWQVFQQLYDTLLVAQPDGTYKGQLAESFEFTGSGNDVQITLRDGIKCHDGTQFDAMDAAYTINRAIELPSLLAEQWGPIQGVETPDKKTVILKYDEPFPGVVAKLGSAFMICDSVADLGDAFGVSAAIGTGPWSLSKWTKGDELVLDRNADFTNYAMPVENPGAPYAERLIAKQVPEAQPRVATIKSGEAHIASGPPLEELPQLLLDESVKVHAAKDTGASMFLEFAASRPPFDDLRARKAIVQALDIEFALDVVFEGAVQHLKCPLAPPILGADADVCEPMLYEYDPGAAQVLLQELGYSADNPLEIKMMTWTGGNRNKVLEVFQSQLAEIGVEASIEVMDIGTLNARVAAENEASEGVGTLDLMGWSSADPDILHVLWRSPGFYKHAYENGNLDALLDKQRTVTDVEERRSIIHDIQKILIEEVMHYPVYTPGWSWLYVSAANVDGFANLVGNGSGPYFNDVQIK
ncbi:ABC transporter substrate-binding protein [Hoeflea prorocentri]|uniref:ABC transporter substrate-binding protein n=1 Tax=Hoeflea prorocentri TaxID=1922333 RepID=A0A9X3UIF1_9HYPH|nr:ABC transporter substrate-binding protein [Hoeflea prorocentri]MCY6381917.1 ABC transporter substrate-binding protein [Hoeflea prorocentri]MDA5399717.1 ABC transporter substrate-binding protein [Hoeflea prorocentri]